LRLSFVSLVVVCPLPVQLSMSSVVDVSSVASSLEQYRLRTRRKDRIARKEKAKYVRPSRAQASLAAVNAARLAERRGDRRSLRCSDAKKLPVSARRSMHKK
jgi:hypothetical protein